jgi:hypothetical protein
MKVFLRRCGSKWPEFLPNITHTLTLIHMHIHICISIHSSSRPSRRRRRLRRDSPYQVSLVASNNCSATLLKDESGACDKRPRTGLAPSFKQANICSLNTDMLFSLKVMMVASGAPGYPRPGLIPGRDGPLGLHHPDLLGRPYADQLAHQVLRFVPV